MSTHATKILLYCSCLRSWNIAICWGFLEKIFPSIIVLLFLCIVFQCGWLEHWSVLPTRQTNLWLLDMESALDDETHAKIIYFLKIQQWGFTPSRPFTYYIVGSNIFKYISLWLCGLHYFKIPDISSTKIMRQHSLIVQSNRWPMILMMELGRIFLLLWAIYMILQLHLCQRNVPIPSHVKATRGQVINW